MATNYTSRPKTAERLTQQHTDLGEKGKTMISIFEAKYQLAMRQFHEMAAFIRLYDSSYERELKQVQEIAEKGANLVRYAEAVSDRLPQGTVVKTD